MYKADTGHYMCHNKFFGRKLTAKGFQETLTEFLHNGYRLRSELIDLIVERLRALHAMLSKQNTFRFYSSSLLVMYDGWELENDWSAGNQSGQSEAPEQSDPQMELGVEENLGSLSTGGHNNSNGTAPPSSSSTTQQCNFDQSHHNHHWDFNSTTPAHGGPYNSPSGNSNTRAQQQHKLIDVRMIDFAHSTREGFRGDKTLHPGPDKGYLFGLETLIHMFEKVKASSYT